MNPASSSTAATSATAAAAIQRALTHILRPLVRLMLAHGITFPALSEILKGLYVEIARDEFTLAGKPQTDSRVSLLSGVHRKDVKRLREAGSPLGVEQPSAVSLGAHVVAAWVGLPEFTDKRKRPLPLPRLARAAAAGAPSFESLVESTSKDIRPRAVLDEWLRLGVVHIDDQDRVCLNQDSFVPEEGFVEKASYLGHNLHDHAAAAVQNMLGAAPAFLERSVYNDNLSDAEVSEMAALAEKAGMDAYRAVIRGSIKLDRRKSPGESGNRRMRFGIYFYADDVAPGAARAANKGRKT